MIPVVAWIAGVSLAAWVIAVPPFVRAGEQASPAASQFAVKFDAGAITSLKRAQDASQVEYVQSSRRLGDILIRWRRLSAGQNGDWQSVSAATLANAGTLSSSGDGTQYKAVYRIMEAESLALMLETAFNIEERAIRWTVAIRNSTDRPVEIGDMALPLPVSRSGSNRSVILKHSYICGHGSFLFWMRSDNTGPALVLVPLEDTSLEYWDSSREAGYRVYVHSAAAGAEAKGRGTNWRQPNTSLTLAPKGQPGDTKSYTFKFRWADDQDAVRQILVDEGGIDVHVVPGMTIPSDLCARFALRTKQQIDGVEAEFPQATTIEPLGTKGDFRLYQVRFSKLGENRLTVRYGGGRHMVLEFFSTEPLETLINKRAAFLARCQHRDASKWYNGLISDWNMETQVLLGPDNYDRIPRGRIYEVTCDDPGLGKPAFLAAKNAEYPVQSEVEALDYYIEHFVWGGLQRTTEETYSYGIYGIPDWKTNRDSSDPGRKGKLHLWRIYDYPHVIVLYFSMYRVAKNHPQIRTAMTADEYLRRAYSTAMAMNTIPHEVWPDWSPYGTGFYNEVVIVDLIDELQAAGATADADRLREHWQRKVRVFVNDRPDLFRSEYAFDSTGFESTHALAKYAAQHVQNSKQPIAGISRESARRFMETQIAANLFCRGWLEPAYYYLGSDYRGGAGNAYTLTYMSQMGGWSVLDYGLNFAANPSPYLRLGYASYLSAWALMNTGTAESNYGYWYPGKANDGGAGGGFEPAPYGITWLGQPHHRGSWYYACEIDLGYCGALRTAATVLADDPIFDRFCFGGDWRKTSDGIEVTCRDGLRRRFHAMLDSGRLHFVSDTDRFPASQPIVLNEDLSEVRFSLESDNAAKHIARIRVSGLPAGKYVVRRAGQPIATPDLKDGQEAIIELPMDTGTAPNSFTITGSKL